MKRGGVTLTVVIVVIINCIIIMIKKSTSSVPPFQWVAKALSPGVQHSGCEDDHSPQSSAEINNDGSYTFTPATYLYGIDRDNFRLTPN
jgi:hypothetical protein